MGLFDFFRGTAKSRDEDFRNKPEVRSLICHTRGQQVLKQVENLHAVGRHKDADEAIWKYVELATVQWGEDPQHPSYLVNTILQVVSMHTNKDFVVHIHELTLQKLDGLLDLTDVYFSLGCVYHKISSEELGGVVYRGGADSVYTQMSSKKKELWAYHMAAEAKAPPGCESPAPPQRKAWAHFMASATASRIGDTEKYEWHRNKLATLVPGIDLNDMEKFIEFTKNTQA